LYNRHYHIHASSGKKEFIEGGTTAYARKKEHNKFSERNQEALSGYNRACFLSIVSRSAIIEFIDKLLSLLLLSTAEQSNPKENQTNG
jgi:hypothetical protein